jgi:hypothetical protein
MTSAAERRREHFRANLRSRTTFWTLFLGLPVAAIAGGMLLHDVRGIAGGPALVLALVLLHTWKAASRESESEFFAALAPTLGLSASAKRHYVATTPLLGAGDRQRYEHAMEGYLYGRLGGPPVYVCRFTYDTRHESENVTVWKPHPFTLCAVDAGHPIPRFQGIYLRPRLSGLGLDHDWIRRHTQRVELESTRFNEVYDLRRSDEQSEAVVRELFSPSLVAWLAENPLRPGFELCAGTVCVFVPGHEDSAGRFILLMEAAREIARRVGRQIEEDNRVQAARLQNRGGNEPWKPHFAAAERS